jgi:hypothetical protein
MVGSQPGSIFISTNNTVYVYNNENGIIQVWREGSTSPTNTSVTNQNNQYALFVSKAGDIYLSNPPYNNQVKVWRENASTYAYTLNVNSSCFSIFIDTNDSLYCSSSHTHTVIKRSLNSNDTQLTTLVGTGCSGYLPYMLYNPRGIFVDINFNLYVADTANHRVQLFAPGQVNGTTLAGTGAPHTVKLNLPTVVMLDADGYIFIADFESSRIVKLIADGFLCLAGCTGGTGAASDRIGSPQGMAFDSYGNIFVVDTNNHRVQKFLLATSSCSKYDTCYFDTEDF